MSVRIVSSASHCPLPNQGALTRTEHGHGHGHGGHLALSIESVRAPKASTESTGTLVHCFELRGMSAIDGHTINTNSIPHSACLPKGRLLYVVVCAFFVYECVCVYVCVLDLL